MRRLSLLGSVLIMAKRNDTDARRIFDQSIMPTLIKLREQGRTYHAIAEALGVGYTTVYRAVNKIESYKARKSA